jgi:hypothetical protein
MADDGGSAGGGAPPPPPVASGGGGGGGHHGPADAVPVNGQNQKPNGNNPPSPVLEEIASLTSPRLFATPNPFSRKNTSLDLDDYFVCTPPGFSHAQKRGAADFGCRLVPETSRSIRNGPSSSRCTAASCPSWSSHSWPLRRGRRGSYASTCMSSPVRRPRHALARWFPG